MGEWEYKDEPSRNLVRVVLARDMCRDPINDDPPRDVVCPHCGAEPGKPCTTTNGIRMDKRRDGTPWVHARRKAASESVRRFIP